MDSDIEIVEDDDLERYHPKGMLNDFSQVKIQVHGADVAERILEDLEDETEDLMDVQHCTEYLELDVVQIQASPEDPGNYLDIPDPISVDLEQLSQNYPEPNHVSEEIDGEDICDDYSERDACNYIEEEPEQEEHAPEEPILENHLDVLTAGQMKDNSYEDVIIKEEIDLFDGTDYTDLDEEPVETYDEDLPPEDICHFNNKIILGSKPCHYKKVNSRLRYDDDLQKEYLTAKVVLEDWGERLEENPCFCKKCGILFATQNVLDSHNMTIHSFLVAVGKNKAIKSTAKPHARAFARKSTVSVTMNNNIAKKSTARSNILVSKFCNHCNKLFPDHTDLIKHLYELLPFTKQFTCNVCKASFNTQKELMKHNTVHVKKEKPQVKKEKIHKDVSDFKKKLVFEEDVKKKHRASSKNEAVFIPLSALFQCSRCNTHFLSIFAGLQHIKTCNLKIVCNKGVTCKICKRRLREVDVLNHKKQHEFSNKFKVYKITQNLYARTLCKCPKCGVHYNDYTINRHWETCGKIPTTCCQKCDILIPDSKLAKHLFKHEKQNLKPNDFIKVQYFTVQNNIKKRKTAPIIVSANKTDLGSNNIIKKEPIANMKVSKVMASKIKKQFFNNSTLVAVKKEKSMTRIKMVNRLKFEKKHKLKMYFCNLCERCYVKETRRSIHLSKKCKVTHLKDRGVCVECGLYVSRKGITAHMKQHRKIHFTIHDIAFYNIRTLRRTVPSIPTYLQCKDCKIIFINKKVRQEHICGENYKTCKACGDKFDISTYDIHIAFHKLVKDEPKDKTEVKIMPKLVKKYESLDIMWNILYSCTKCEIVTDSYDKAVEHSQTHLNNTATCKNIKCYICNLKFDETCWSKHSDLHSRMNINSKDFKILKYNPKVLKSEEWFELFDTLSQEQIRQITDKSWYGYERSVTMKLLKDGRPEFTLYCCSDCKICFQHYEISKHMSSACKKSANYCKICNIPFNDVNALRLHEILHVKGIKKEEFRIVSFLKNKVGPKKSTGIFVINKCRQCNISVRYKHNLNRHVCRPKSQSSICSICHLIFNKRNMPKHMREHKLKPNLKPKNIQVDLFDPCNIADNLYYDEDDGFNLKPVKRKYQTDHTKVSKPAKVPKTDTRKSTKTSKASINDTPIMVKVFKCECGLHYISLKTIEKHIETCSSDSNISKENCSKCGLLFPTDVLVNHLCKHHSKNTKIVIETYKKTVKPESFESVESTSESPTSKMVNSIKKSPISTKKMAKSQSQNNQVKLYKCSDCNVYYLSQNTCYKHISKDHKPLDPRLYVECKQCGLQFTIRSLYIHISNHHQNEFNLDNVLVEEYHPRCGKQPAKIDIYMASEKLQSLQVTSSIDETNISNS